MGERCDFGNCQSRQGPQGCRVNADCPGANQLCIGGVCQAGVQCTSDGDCNFPQVCISNQCIISRPCMSDQDCTGGRLCIMNQCQASP